MRDPLADVVPPDDAVEVRRLRNMADALERLTAEVDQRKASLNQPGKRLAAVEIRVHDLQKLIEEDQRTEIDSGPGAGTPNLKRELEQAVFELEDAQRDLNKELEELMHLNKDLSNLRRAVASMHVDFQNYICVRR